ncbi:DUF975 family protein [Candidatus Kaiserbacteria bacterium]|nr:DUF975 family protein [Candidatus Kaiserbacteria bacterium]
MNTFSVGEAIRFGWELFKKRPWLVIGAFVLTGMLSVSIQFTFGPEEGAPVNIPAMVLIGILSVVVGTLAEIGMITFSLRAHDAIDTVGIRDIWNPKLFLPYVFGRILVGIVVIVGLILLIVPGVILSFGFMFTSYLIVDKGLGPVAAMKESWRITKGHKWQLALLGLAFAGLNILGLLALVVGLLVTIPVTLLAAVHVYRTLEHKASEMVSSTGV